MRPRHKAAENLILLPCDIVGYVASMRPRHKAAENLAIRFFLVRCVSCFNEAAA